MSGNNKNKCISQITKNHNITIVPESDSESDAEEASKNLFPEDTIKSPIKKIKLSVTGDDASTYCSSPHSLTQEELHEQNAQKCSDTEDDIKFEIPTLHKQFTDASVMTTLPYPIEIDENTRISNLMFCKFIAHELDKCEGNERYEVMQKNLEVLKSKN